jgi:deoxyribonuclease-4
MKYVGAHISASGGVENAPLNAHGIGARAFAFFTKNQKQWVAPPLTHKSIDAFRKSVMNLVSDLTRYFRMTVIL